MFAELKAKLRSLPPQERVNEVMSLLTGSWDADDHARLTRVLVHDLRQLGRNAEAIAYVNSEVQRHISPVLKSRLLEFRALDEIDRGDEVAALATLVEMERHGIADIQMPEVYGIRARALALNGDQEAYLWFERACDAARDAGNPALEQAHATWAALFAVDEDRDAKLWLSRLPDHDPYRLALEADLAAVRGDHGGAADLAEAAISAPDSSAYIKARARFVQAQLAYPNNRDRALYLIEQALTLALTPASTLNGVEPRLIERIRRFKCLCEREGVVS